jgi:hypothetical protein
LNSVPNLHIHVEVGDEICSRMVRARLSLPALSKRATPDLDAKVMGDVEKESDDSQLPNTFCSKGTGRVTAGGAADFCQYGVRLSVWARLGRQQCAEGTHPVFGAAVRP